MKETYNFRGRNNEMNLVPAGIKLCSETGKHLNLTFNSLEPPSGLCEDLERVDGVDNVIVPLRSGISP